MPLYGRELTGGCFWGAIAGGKRGPCLVWDKSWGKITTTSYCQHVMPLIYIWWVENPQFRIMHDNTLAYRA